MLSQHRNSNRDIFHSGVCIRKNGKNQKREQEREILEQEIRMYENQFEIIQQSQINTRSLKHDMKHHIKNAV